MSKKAKHAAVQRFPEAKIAKWRELLQDSSVHEVLDPLVCPQSSASQLKAVKKVKP